MNATALRVLIVEDEPIIAIALEDMVGDLGHHVAASVASLDEGLRAAAAGGFDIALLDLNLGGERSTPIAEWLQVHGVPFVFATGYGSSDLTAAFPDVPLIAKPYAPRTLADALARAGSRG